MKCKGNKSTFSVESACELWCQLILVSQRAANEPRDTAVLPASPAGLYHLRERRPKHTLVNVINLGFAPLPKEPLWAFYKVSAVSKRSNPLHKVVLWVASASIILLKPLMWVFFPIALSAYIHYLRCGTCMCTKWQETGAHIQASSHQKGGSVFNQP